jgi:hypothetical protein
MMEAEQDDVGDGAYHCRYRAVAWDQSPITQSREPVAPARRSMRGKLWPRSRKRAQTNVMVRAAREYPSSKFLSGPPVVQLRKTGSILYI